MDKTLQFHPAINQPNLVAPSVSALLEKWPILLDAQILQASRIVIGSGLVKSKLSLPGEALASLPGAIVIEGLASKISI